jgi:uncharacterized protein (TIGR03066 family)
MLHNETDSLLRSDLNFTTRLGTTPPGGGNPRIVVTTTKVALLVRRSAQEEAEDSGNLLENNMNAKLSIVLVACVALFVSACAPSPQSLILGKWEVESAPMKMTAEFSRDGTAKITMLGQTLQGTYKLDQNELVWTMNGTTTKGKVNVTPTELELTDDANRTIKYKRK